MQVNEFQANAGLTSFMLPIDLEPVGTNRNLKHFGFDPLGHSSHSQLELQTTLKVHIQVTTVFRIRHVFYSKHTIDKVICSGFDFCNISPVEHTISLWGI